MNAEANKRQNRLIILCWFLYTVTYLGKYSYNSNINRIMEAFSVEKTATGLVGSFFFFAYGAGQIVNGLLCQHYPKKYVLSGAAVISALLNLTVFLGIDFRFYKVLWLLNGAATSVFWSSLMLVLGENVSRAKLRRAVLMMATTVPLGTLISYSLSALFAKVGVPFQYSFLFGGAMLVIAGAVWFFSYERCLTKDKSILEEDDKPAKAKTAMHTKAFTESVLVVITVLCVFAVITNLMKDGLNTWLPTILKDSFRLDDSSSLIFTLVLPVFGVLGSTFAMAMNKKIKNFIILDSIFIVGAGVFCAVALWLLTANVAVLLAVICGLIFLLVSASNNVITSMAPLYLRGKINSGLIAGILNGFCYVGSTLSSYGLGYVALHSGWSGVFKLLIALAVFVAIVCIGYSVSLIVRRKEAAHVEAEELARIERAQHMEEQEEWADNGVHSADVRK